MRSVYPEPRRRWKGHHETGAPPGPAYRLRHRLLRARRERPRGCRAAEQRDELALFSCQVPPVLPTDRIAHLGTADCCIHPPGCTTIAVTPPKIFSKEVAQKQATPFPRQDLLTARNRF